MTHDTHTLDRLGSRIRQMICSFHGHDVLRHIEHNRITLRCTSCDYESPGWNLRAAPEPGAGSNAHTRAPHMALARETHAG